MAQPSDLDQREGGGSVAKLPGEGSINLGLALHMLFFVADLERSLIRMARFLAPGGRLFIVLADESDGYTDYMVAVPDTWAPQELIEYWQRGLLKTFHRP